MGLRICILTLLGLPAAGKTTFSRWLLSLAPAQRPFNVAHLCFDDISNSSPTATATHIDFKLQRKEFLKILESFVAELKRAQLFHNISENQIKTAITPNSKDFLIICDDNNYYRSMRYQIFQLARCHSLAYAQVYFECSLSTALTRNSQRPATEQIPQHILQQMSTRMDIPDPVHYAWEAWSLILDSRDLRFSIENIVPFLYKSFEHIFTPFVNNSSPKVSQLPSTLHQLDLLLRRRIGELLQLESSGVEKQAKGNTLNAKRKEIMQKLRTYREEEVVAILNKAKDMCEFLDLLQ